MKFTSLNQMFPALVVALSLVLLTATPGFTQGGGCSHIAFSVENYQACCYRLHVDNSSECYPSITLLLDAGSFVGWGAGTQGGWTGTLVSPTQLLLTHSSGIIPLGASTPVGFCLPPGFSANLTILYDYTCPLGKGCFFEIPLEGCPIMADGCISGVKYVDVHCAHLPYSDQPTLADWPIRLYNAGGMVLDSMVTNAAGAYAFCDLPPGNYVVKEASQPGWTSSVPASGQYSISLGQSQQAERNFGNCPACSCDSIYLGITQQLGTADTSTYYLSTSNSGPYCFSFVDIQVDTGQLSGWEVLLPGWTATLQAPNILHLSPPGPLLPAGGTIPLRFQVTGGGGIDQISTTTSLGSGPGTVACPRSFVFPRPPAPLAASCCPSGSNPGPELVTNGDFINVTPGGGGYSSQYVYTALGAGPGFYSVLNGYGVANSTGVGFWSCIGKSGNPTTDYFMLIDGSTIAGKVAWQQTVTVIQGGQYAFCAYLNNMVIPTLNYANPNVELYVDATQVATVSLGELPTAWQQLSGLITVGPGAHTLKILTSSTAYLGNDFALDCISFRLCAPPCTASFTAQASGCKYTFTSVATGTPAYSYAWNFGDPLSGPNNSSALSNPMHQFVTAGPHTVMVTITDGTGCTATYSATITVPPLPTVTISASPSLTICQGQSATLTANGAAGSSYAWSNFQNTPFIIVNSAGTSCVICTDPNGCTATACATVTVTPLPVPNAGPDQNVCLGQSVSLLATGGGAYQWSPGGSTANPYNVTPGITTTYTLTVTLNGCTATDQVTVTVKPLPVVNAGPDQLICTGTSATLTATGGAGTPPYTYWWTPGGSAANPFNTGALSGNTTYTVQATDANGCTATDQATVTVQPEPSVNAGPDQSICPGQTVVLQATGSGGAPPLSYLWTPGNLPNPASVSPSVTTTYTMVVTDANGCTGFDFTTVTVKPAPVVTAGLDQTICIGTPAALTAGSGAGTPPYTYWWTPGGSTANPYNVTPGTTTTYTVQSTDANGCTGTDQVTVVVAPPPPANAGPDQAICIGTPATLTASGGVTYQWSPNGSGANPYAVSPVTATTYTVTVTDLNGCTATDQVTVTVNPYPIADAGPDQTICAGQPAILQASGGGTYQWFPGGTTANPYTSVPGTTTTYTVYVTQNGCTTTDQVTVFLQTCCQNSLIQNGDFSSGSTPLGLEDIWGATDWSGIWPAGFGTNHNGDYWGPNGALNPPLCSRPVPYIQGYYGGFWCWYSPNKQYRQGIMNQLSTSIAPNSGCYNVSFKLACLCGSPWGGKPKLDVWGVAAGAVSTITTSGPAAYFPGNDYLFWDPTMPFASNSEYFMGQIEIPTTCNDNFLTYNFQFNSQGATTGPLDRIFFTRRDGNGFGGAAAYLAIDDVCVEPATCFVPDPCACSAPGSTTIYQVGSGFSSPIATNTQPPAYIQVPCAKAGQNYRITGSYPCNLRSCGNNAVSWELTGPSGTFTGVSNVAYPNFSVNLPWWYFSQNGGVYAVTITRQCGTNTCSATYHFIMAPCPCECDNQFYASVSQGFSVSSYPVSGCTFSVQPAALCADDVVTWTIAGTGAAGTSKGNTPLSVTFPGPGYRTICMTVTRPTGIGTTCTFQQCQTLFVKCTPNPSNPVPYAYCGTNQVSNGDFTGGLTAGFLNEDGMVADWQLAPNSGEGLVYVEDSTGGDDPGHLILLGGKGRVAGIMQPLELSWDTFTVVEYSLRNYLGPHLPPGTALEFWLQDEPFPGFPAALIYREMLDSSSGSWSHRTFSPSTVFPADTAPYRRYLVISLINDSETVRSVIGLDNLEICTDATSGTSLPQPERTRMRIFPNPNAGTFSVELPEAARPGTTLRIIDLTGRQMLMTPTEAGSARQTVRTGELPAGLYFLQVVSDSRVLAAEKFVKQ